MPVMDQPRMGCGLGPSLVLKADDRTAVSYDCLRGVVPVEPLVMTDTGQSVVPDLRFCTPSWSPIGPVQFLACPSLVS